MKKEIYSFLNSKATKVWFFSFIITLILWIVGYLTENDSVLFLVWMLSAYVGLWALGFILGVFFWSIPKVFNWLVNKSGITRKIFYLKIKRDFAEFIKNINILFKEFSVVLYWIFKIIGILLFVGLGIWLIIALGPLWIIAIVLLIMLFLFLFNN